MEINWEAVEAFLRKHRLTIFTFTAIEDGMVFHLLQEPSTDAMASGPTLRKALENAGFLERAQ